MASSTRIIVPYLLIQINSIVPERKAAAEAEWAYDDPGFHSRIT
jgi:hypothetical protein